MVVGSLRSVRAIHSEVAPPLRPHLGDKAASILIVEDDQLARDALSMVLKSRGYSTRTAESAEAALGQVEQFGMPGIALVDLDLPGMNGLELLARLTRFSPTLQSVLITAEGSDALLALVRRQGVLYLQKPFLLHSLLRLLNPPPTQN